MGQKKKYLEETRREKNDLVPESDKPKQIERKLFKAVGGKKIKKDISRLWKVVVKSVNACKIPDSGGISDLLNSCEDYNLHTNREWADLWRDCFDKVKECTIAARNGDFDTAKEKIVEVNRLTKECHKKYK